jgi:hypothetical protein
MMANKLTSLGNQDNAMARQDRRTETWSTSMLLYTSKFLIQQPVLVETITSKDVRAQLCLRNAIASERALLVHT